MRRRWPERFWEKINKTDGCWLWTGTVNSRGRAVLTLDGHSRYASRIILELIGRPLEPGQFACHTCDNGICVNPDHLYAGSPADNSHDMWTRNRGHRRSLGLDERKRLRAASDAWLREHPRKPHCWRGHPLVEGNIVIRKNGDRRCRTCLYDRLRESEARRRLDPERHAHRLAKAREYSARYKAKHTG